MPNYYIPLSRAVSDLEPNTPERREALFGRAREILVDQLRARRPAPTEPEIQHECAALEDAIRRIEESLLANGPACAESVDTPSSKRLEPPSGTRIIEQGGVDGGAPRGRVIISDHRKTIELSKTADVSTPMHLMAHLWLDELVHDGGIPNAPQRIKCDLQTVFAWLGVKKPDDIGMEQRQKWARGFERYLMEGNPPSAALAPAFRHFREQLQAIYPTSTALGAPLPEEIKGVFDRMLATDEETSHPATPARASPRASPETDSLGSILKGVFGAVSGFIVVLGLELALFGGMELLPGHQLRPIGLGWIALPIAAGAGGWKLFREIDFGVVARSISMRVFLEFGVQNREHKIALALVILLGWAAGALVGFFASLAGDADYYPRTLGTWLFGRWERSYFGELSVQYFPWASLAWGLAGGAISVVVVYIRRLLRSGTGPLEH